MRTWFLIVGSGSLKFMNQNASVITSKLSVREDQPSAGVSRVDITSNLLGVDPSFTSKGRSLVYSGSTRGIIRPIGYITGGIRRVHCGYTRSIRPIGGRLDSQAGSWVYSGQSGVH